MTYRVMHDDGFPEAWVAGALDEDGVAASLAIFIGGDARAEAAAYADLKNDELLAAAYADLVEAGEIEALLRRPARPAGPLARSVRRLRSILGELGIESPRHGLLALMGMD